MDGEETGTENIKSTDNNYKDIKDTIDKERQDGRRNKTRRN